MSRKFRFASLLQWRERQRDEAGAEVGQAIEAINRIDQQRHGILQQQNATKEDTATLLLGELSIDRLLSGGRYTMQLEMDLRQLADTREQLVQALLVRQEKLMLAEAEVKRFERLKELDREAQQKLELRREQLSLDEAVSNRYLLRRRNNTQNEG
jgi:flagellar protein FliJ